MVVVPTDKPVAIPLTMPIVATAGVLLVHTPPVTASVNVTVVPTHWVVGPVIGFTIGTGFKSMILAVVLVPQLLVTT